MNNYTQLDTVLEEIKSRWGIPGLGIGIVENGQMVYARGFGVQSLETDTSVTTKSIFCLASIAKCFVASAIMTLVEQGKLNLDTSIIEYLPEFRLDSEHYPEITLRQMLSHTSGMPDMDEIEYDHLIAHPEYDEDAPARFVVALSTRKMIGLPGERFAYSNIAYNVFGHLISKTSGSTFEDYMKEHLLEPSGMPNSTFFFPDVPQDQFAMPHIRIPEMRVNPILAYHRADAPASFLYSNIEEMCHWAMISLNRGSSYGNRILSPSSYDLMWTPIAKRGYPPFREEMGLGWAVGHFEGVQTISHGGGGFGWTCHLILLPERNSGAIILSNEESSAIEALEQAVIRAVLGLEPQVGPVSWMIPISQALHKGGIQKAFTCYEEIRNQPTYFFDPYDLITLAYQLNSVKKFVLATDVLKLNLYVFPDHQYTKSLLDKISM
ncbi:MAG: serine hydrolase domain-containing protein [Anaerolineales bacterium]